MKDTKGFTLIELLVVVAIIGVLASIVLASLNSARAKSRDARRISDFRQISLALNLYYDSNGTMPSNPTPGIEVCDGSVEYNTLMQGLVTAGFLSGIPRSPGNQGGGTWPGYCYYNYGINNAIGALIVTTLEAAPNSVNGLSPSCRPWLETDNTWCEKDSTKFYCLCNLY